MGEPTGPGSSNSACLRGGATWTFFRQWLRNPLVTAAFAPSGRQLAERMLAAMPGKPRGVVELGAGTGVFTEALLASGIAPEALLVVELNEELHQLLQRRFPAVQVVCGDAARLPDIARHTGFSERIPVDAVLSGLGFLSMPRTLQRAILTAVFEVLAPGGVFVQFTYGPASPIPRELLDERGLRVRRAGTAWRNFPPAGVYVYSRAADAAALPAA